MTNVLGMVCARKGSKRLPGKNTRIIDGISLLESTVRTLRQAGIEDIVVTTDFPLEFDLDKYGGQHIFRTENISLDDMPLQETVKWAYFSLNKQYEYIVCLMPNCPMVDAEAVRKAVNIITGNRCNVVRSYNRQGLENGLIAVRTRYLLDHFIDVYCGCVICVGDEIHDEQDYVRMKKIMEESDGTVDRKA
jgi:CMP-N-acetylneuraminic acid synthetase